MTRCGRFLQREEGSEGRPAPRGLRGTKGQGPPPRQADGEPQAVEHAHGPGRSPRPPVRMFLNASSTLVESKAEVSMKDKLFFSGTEDARPSAQACLYLAPTPLSHAACPSPASGMEGRC